MPQPLEFRHPLPRMRLVRREQFILERCRGKKVLHLGFVDSGMTSERIASGDWLHGRISDVASRTVGVDADAEGVAYLRSLGISDIVEGDIERLDALGLDLDFDVVVAGEVLEHLTCPGSFLKSVRPFVEAPGTLIVTVPNAFHHLNFKNAAEGIEMVHPDHKYWFSHTTATNLLVSCGLEILDVLGYVPSEAEANALAPAPHLCNGLILIARAAGEEEGTALG